MDMYSGVRVCGDVVLCYFWCDFAEFLFSPVVLQFHKTKRFSKFSKMH